MPTYGNYSDDFQAGTIRSGSLSGTVGSLQFLGAEPERHMLILFNDSAGACYVKYGPGANSNNFTVKIAAQGYWELPKPAYTGSLTAKFDLATGSLYFTEF